MRFCCMQLESAAPQEVDALPQKSDTCPGRPRQRSPWRRQRRGEVGGIHDVLVLLVKGWAVYGMSAYEPWCHASR